MSKESTESHSACSKGSSGEKDPPKPSENAAPPVPEDFLAATRENMKRPQFWRQHLAVQTPHLKAAVLAFLENRAPFLLNWTEFRVPNEEEDVTCEAKSNDDVEIHGHCLLTCVNCGNCESRFATSIQFTLEGGRFDECFARFCENHYGSLALTFEAHQCVAG